MLVIDCCCFRAGAFILPPEVGAPGPTLVHF
jgi:hypothetical protein